MDFEFTMKHQMKRPKIDQEYEFSDGVQIGRGTYGRVYKAIQKSQETWKNTENPKYYALKEMSSSSPSTCRELALYRELNHRNVMNLLAVYLSYPKQKVWLLFDYAEYDLHTIIKFYQDSKTQIPETLQKSCLFQTLNGLKYLHDNWILHRDLKPANILVMGEGPMRGCIKITDMGMARLFNSPLKPLTDVDAVVCTCWYRAPELLLGSRHYTKAVDLFSFGCIMAELLTTKPIFASKFEDNQQQIDSPYTRVHLEEIFRVLGFPSVSTWPDIRQLPEYGRLQTDFKKNSFINCTLVKHFKKNGIDPQLPCFDLLSNLLIYDPKKRISSIDALRHQFFSIKPFPSKDVFNCFTQIPFPNRKFLKNDNSMKTINPVNRLNVNIRRIDANFLTQLDYDSNNVDIVKPGIIPNHKFQPIERVTRRTFLQERNF